MRAIRTRLRLVVEVAAAVSLRKVIQILSDTPGGQHEGTRQGLLRYVALDERPLTHPAWPAAPVTGPCTVRPGGRGLWG
ncbi:hypothetical protein GCM10009760_38540 [Kitasatospora kazusensis]|uniref:Uncharacterized protein n=1 Tax=Kitasatospora kazusensis TaxID=407974 RepID=A0ABN2ZU25_9ACTN